MNDRKEIASIVFLKNGDFSGYFSNVGFKVATSLATFGNFTATFCSKDLATLLVGTPALDNMAHSPEKRKGKGWLALWRQTRAVWRGFSPVFIYPSLLLVSVGHAWFAFVTENEALLLLAALAAHTEDQKSNYACSEAPGLSICSSFVDAGTNIRVFQCCSTGAKYQITALVGFQGIVGFLGL